MKTIHIGSTTLRCKPENEDVMRAAIEKASRIPTPRSVNAKFANRRDSRKYPAFAEGMSTAEYVREFYVLNAAPPYGGISKLMRDEAHGQVAKLFEPLSKSRQFSQPEQSVEEDLV